MRPIKTGKQARETEFGAKGALTHVDGFLFLDFWKHEAFNEADSVARYLEAYGERFGKLTRYFVGDMKYGTLKNRTDLETLGVRPSFKPLGRMTKQRDDAWFKKKQKERNRIEGGFGHEKKHFGPARVRYKGEETSEVRVRFSWLLTLPPVLKYSSAVVRRVDSSTGARITTLRKKENSLMKKPPRGRSSGAASLIPGGRRPAA